jgi:hypothetical protein
LSIGFRTDCLFAGRLFDCRVGWLVAQSFNRQPGRMDGWLIDFFLSFVGCFPDLQVGCLVGKLAVCLVN